MLTLLAKFLKLLNSETDPGQIALAFCFAMVAGLTPLMSLHNLLVLLLILVLRVNLSAFILGLGVFTVLAFALDPVFDQVGFAVLTMKSLEGLWTDLYNSTLWRVEYFNNTIVMGSLLLSVIAFIPAYFVFSLLIVKYRETFLEWLKKTKIAQAIKASTFWNIYQKVEGWRQ